MRKSPHQEIAAPEVASDDANNSGLTAEPQENKIDRQTVGSKAAKYFTTKRITLLAVFVAMALVMKLLGKSLTITPTFTVTFIYLPWLLSGVVLGPISGMIVGGISDVLGNLIFGAPFLPLTFVSNTLFALPIGLIYRFPIIKNDYIKCGIGALCSLLICTLGIGSFSLYHYYGYINSMSFMFYLWTMRMPQVGVFAINVVVLLALIKPLQSVGIFPAPRAAASNLPRYLIFGICTAVFTALYVTATAFMVNNIAPGTTSEETLANTAKYVAVGAVYAALLMQSALIIAGKNRLAVTLITAGTVIALAVAVAFMMNTQWETLKFTYLISIAATLAALLLATSVARHIAQHIRRKQNK